MDKLTSKQISEWEAYNRIDPIGDWRTEFNTARLESLIINIVSHLYTKKGHSPLKTNPVDFMPDWLGEGREDKKQTVEEMKQILMSFAQDQNRRSKKREIPPVKKTKKP